MTTVPPPPRHERTRQVAVRLGFVALAVPVVLFTGASRVVAEGSHPGQNPRANVMPTPNFEFSGSCTGAPGSWHCANPCVTTQLTFPAHSNAPSCAAYVLRALNAARSSEHLRAIVLPSNWFSLSVPEQLFVLADLERTARGLPPYLGLNATLSADARHAAANDADPVPARGFAVALDRRGAPRVGGTWASGTTSLGADFLWMYADGWGGSAQRTANTACTSPRAAACWAHRDELLGADQRLGVGVGLHCTGCEMGAGFAVRGGTGSVRRPGRAPAIRRAGDDLHLGSERRPVPRAERGVPASRRRAPARSRTPCLGARHLAAVQHARHRWSATPCLTPRVESPTGLTTCRAKTFKRAGK